MSTTLPLRPTSPPVISTARRRLVVGRAVLALAWAVGLVLALRGEAPATDADVPTGAAVLVATYPLIDVIASLVGARLADARALRANAAVSAVAVAGVGAAAFGSDAGATLSAFGAWAVVSGALQLALALHRRRAAGGQVLMIVSGGLSALAGIGFVGASRGDEAQLATLAGYMTVGAILFLLSARRADPASGLSTRPSTTDR